MLETKYVGDKFEILVTVLIVSPTTFADILESGFQLKPDNQFLEIENSDLQIVSIGQSDSDFLIVLHLQTVLYIT